MRSNHNEDKRRFGCIVKGRIRQVSQQRGWTLQHAVHCSAMLGAREQKSAEEWLYKRYFGYLFTICLRYVRHREDAEELVNESFVRIFANAKSFVCRGNEEEYERLFRGWIARISVHASIDFLRTKKRHESLDDELFQESDLPKGGLSDELEVRDILALLSKLPEVQRLIFNLFEVEGYKHDEISVMLDIPESTSRTYLTRAKKKLRSWYEQMHQSV